MPDSRRARATTRSFPKSVLCYIQFDSQDDLANLKVIRCLPAMLGALEVIVHCAGLNNSSAQRMHRCPPAKSTRPGFSATSYFTFPPPPLPFPRGVFTNVFYAVLLLIFNWCCLIGMGKAWRGGRCVFYRHLCVHEKQLPDAS